MWDGHVNKGRLEKQDVEDVNEEILHKKDVVVTWTRRYIKWIRHPLRKNNGDVAKLQTAFDKNIYQETGWSFFWIIIMFSVGRLLDLNVSTCIFTFWKNDDQRYDQSNGKQKFRYVNDQIELGGDEGTDPSPWNVRQQEEVSEDASRNSWIIPRQLQNYPKLHI